MMFKIDDLNDKILTRVQKGGLNDLNTYQYHISISKNTFQVDCKFDKFQYDE